MTNTQYERSEEIKRHKAHVAKLKKHLDDGHCHGFSVCHAAMGMDEVDKLDWWENVLVTLANWDGTHESLHKIVDLPDSITTETLNNLFYRALYYIVCNQVQYKNGFSLRHADQNNLLQPASKENQHLALVSDEGKSFRIQNRTIAAGYFSEKNMLVLLKKNQVKGNICLIHNGDHAIRIGHDGKSWFIYNPNFDHKNLQSICRRGSKKEIIRKIFNIQGHCISIETASAKEKKLEISPFEHWIKTRPKALLKETGLLIIAQHRPDLLTDIIGQSAQQADLLQALTQSLTKTNNNGWTGVHMIARFAPKTMLKLCQLAVDGNHKSLLKALTQSLTKTTDNGWTGVHMIARYAPKAMSILCQLAGDINHTSLLKALTQSLTKTNDNGWTGLHTILANSPDSMRILWKIAIERPDADLLHIMTWKLWKKHKDGARGLHLLCLHMPELIPAMMPSLLKYHRLDYIFNLLVTPYANVTAWQMLCKNGSNFVEKICKMMVSKLQSTDSEEILQFNNSLDNAIKQARLEQSDSGNIYTLFKTKSWLGVLATMTQEVIDTHCPTNKIFQ